MMRKTILALALSSALGVATTQLLAVDKAVEPGLSYHTFIETNGTLSGRIWFAICCDCSGTGDETSPFSIGDDDDDGGCGGSCCNCPPVEDETSPIRMDERTGGQHGDDDDDDDDDDDGGACDGSGSLDVGGVTVDLFDGDGNLVDSQVSAQDGSYSFSDLAEGSYRVQVADLTLPSGVRPVFDVDGTTTQHRAVVQLDSGENRSGVDFGYGGCAPGTGTLGYWKNHPDAWPEEQITVGGVTYGKDEAIAILRTPSRGDKTYDLFKQLVAAQLNVQIGNPSSCVTVTIAEADAWLVTYPLGSRVRSSSSAWATGAPLHATLDDYNNGELCAPHRG